LSCYVILFQILSGCFGRPGWLYQDSTSYVMLGHVISCWARLGEFRPGYARLFQRRSGYYMLGQDITC